MSSTPSAVNAKHLAIKKEKEEEAKLQAKYKEYQKKAEEKIQEIQQLIENQKKNQKKTDASEDVVWERETARVTSNVVHSQLQTAKDELLSAKTSLKVQKVRKHYSYIILPCVFAFLRLCVFASLRLFEN